MRPNKYVDDDLTLNFSDGSKVSVSKPEKVKDYP